MKRKIIVLSILFLPMILVFIYLFASSNNAVKILLDAPHVSFEGLSDEYNFIIDFNNVVTINEEEEIMIFNYHNMFYEDIEVEGILKIPFTKVISLQGEYYNLNENNQLVKSDLTNMLQDSLFEKGFSIGMSTILGGIALFFIVMMTFKKMDFHKSHKRLSVLLTSYLVSGIFLFLSIITNQMTLVFITFSLEWTVYYFVWRSFRKADGLPPYEGVTPNETR